MKVDFYHRIIQPRFVTGITGHDTYVYTTISSGIRFSDRQDCHGHFKLAYPKSRAKFINMT